MTRFKKEIVNVNEIKLDPDNPNQLSTLEQQSLSYSIKKWGYVDTIVIDQNNVVANGEHRLQSLKEEGFEDIEVIRYNFKNDTERRLFRQSFNKIRGRHDPALDSGEFLSILQDDKDNILDLIRLTAEESDQKIYELINKYNPSTEFESLLNNDENRKYKSQKLLRCPQCGYEYDK